jgi:hypothetical protein
MRFARTVADGLIAVAIGVAFTVLPVAFLFWLIIASTCRTEKVKKFYNMSGYNFEVTHTDCDAIAKWHFIDVLVAKGGSTRQTVLLEYVPAVEALPVIKLVGAKAFRISIPRISSLRLRRDRWENLSLDYDIGSIEYPEKASDSK